MVDLIGQRLGPYEITLKIGQGGMATVFKAYQASLDRSVAIKVLLPALAASDPDFTKRFQREALAIARLNHPYILPVYDVGVERDYRFIVMRYVDSGRTLARVMRQPLSQTACITFIEQIGEALGYAHRQGIIHRDLKPSNVLIDEGWPLLSDFGLAKLNKFQSSLTETGMRIGTPAYMSPEQARGETVDQRTDIYALGVILYEMLTQTIPHEAETPWTFLLKRTTEPPLPPRRLNPDISPNVERVLLRTLALEPQNRYDKVANFVRDLQQAVTGHTDNIEPLKAGEEETTLSRPSAPPRNVWRQWRWLALSLVIFVGLAWGGFAVRDPTPTDSALATGLTIAAMTAIPTQTAPAVSATFTASSTSILSSPTATPTPSPTATAPPTASPIVLVATATPAPTPTLTIPPPPSPTPTLTPAPPTGTFDLLAPLSLDDPSYGPTVFEWAWVGDLPPGYGFEVRVWREGELPAGVHNAVLDNQAGIIEQIGENHYRFQADIGQATGVEGRTGEYLWSVGVVQIEPDYADLGSAYWATPARLRFEAGGSSSSSGDDNGNGNGTSSGPTIQ